MNFRTADRLSHVKEYYFSRKLRELNKLRAKGVDVINLGIGSPDLAPDPVVIETLSTAAADSTNHGYQSYAGIPQLRSAFAGWYNHHFGVTLNPDLEILPLIGSKEGIMHISMTYLQEGDEVLVPDPGYPSYSATAKLAGAQVRTYPLTPEKAWQPDLEWLAAQDLTKVRIMWLNYPHMPTGAKANLAIFSDLIDLARQHNILLCHDNPYAFILNDEPLSLLQIDGAQDVALELTSLSKTFNMAGWRVGAVVGHSDRINEILKFKSNMDSGMFRPIQMAAIKALELDKNWYSEMNSIYRVRRNEAERLLKSVGCEIDSDQVGMFVWGRIPDQYKSAEELSDKVLDESGVFITPGHIFGSQGERYLRVSLCSPKEVIEQARQRCSPMTPLKSEI
ncbi:MAG: aminotransferase class I/II-fold pyridoxal phosphate-dependent enzyme [Saprospiraceae bacterium]|nr:aminotransferase class I/II-fold pyridoxal phosphate-dependent enzyme [Saprospiraceae bacterium]